MALPTKQKPSVVIVYTGSGKGKTSAGIGLVCRSLGRGNSVAFVQFIKAWKVNEDRFFESISNAYGDKLSTYKGGKGFYNAGDMSAQNVTESQHKSAAQATFAHALGKARSGTYDLVVCDEINNAMHDGLLDVAAVRHLITSKHETTSLCLTGRNFPEELASHVDILTEMTLIKHHFDDGFIANEGIDY